MKRTTIIIISLVIGISFFGLLLLQGRIVKAMVKMRKEQFDETVFRALDQTSRDLERNETFRYLETMAQQTGFEAENLNDKESQQRIQEALELGDSAVTPFRVKSRAIHPSRMPKALTLQPATSLDAASQRFQEFVKNAYLYQKGVLDEVINTILYNASERDFRDRVDFRLLDSNLRSELMAAGITLNYHFTVYDANGVEVFRCEEFDSKGSDYSYTQPLFRNDPSQKMGILRVHFPELDSYILGAARTMLPSLFFTLILFFTFCFTVWLIARQKRDTEMKNDFINNMTHEFKTPISSISLAAQMLKDDTITKSPTMLSHLSGVIVDETKRLRFQVEKVLQMSMFDHKKVTFKKRELELNELVDGVINTFNLKVEASGGKIDSSLAATSSKVYVDEMHLTNVVFNLMDNAVKYKKEDVDIHLNVRTWNDATHVYLSIADNGIGIKKENLKKIFEKFYRVHTGNRHDVKGFGLGLAYVKQIVDLHKGTIHAESEIGKGTKFIIKLPLC